MMTNRQRSLLITGTNRGTGRAIAEKFQEKGYKIASLNRTLSRKPLLGEFACDLADKAAVDQVCGNAIRYLNGIDVCILNAATRRLTGIEEMANVDWDDSIETNLSSTFRIVRHCIPEIKKSGGMIIILGSQAGSFPFEGGAAYCATKAALEAFTEVLIKETRPMGIRTLLVVPGAIRNRPDDQDDGKISPHSLADLIMRIIDLPEDLLVSRIELRPFKAKVPTVIGLDRLQSW